MHVNSSALGLVSQHAATEFTVVQQRFEIRRAEAAVTAAPQDDLDITDQKTLLAMLLYEQFTGRKAVRAGASQSAGSGGPARQAAPSVTYTRREIHHESERTSFRAEGSVTTAAGAKIQFSLGLELNRELTQINTVTFGTGNATDPIAVNLDGAGVRLNPERRQFDLNGDGIDEAIATLAEGSAWLTLDANANGAVDNGLELFGPRGGDGFAELAALDEDNNGWIDEGDSAYDQLGLWNHDSITSLRDAGIGALSVNSVSTPFALKDGAELLGQVRASGVYLRESGAPGVLQQVDLKV